jgi:hypothetical protein
VVFERFHSWLRPFGYLLFTVEPYDEPGRVGDWLGAPMFFSQYDAISMAALVRNAGFHVLTQAVETQREGEREVNFLWVLAQSNEAPADPDQGR